MYLIAGVAKDPFGSPVPGTIVTVHDRSSGDILGVTNADPETGKFVVNGLLSNDEVYVTINFPGRSPQIFDQVDPVTEVVLTQQNRFVVNICDINGIVEAVVDGDITGHTILWEQIEGPPVTLVGADTLTPTFDNNPVGQTRIFRLTIDAGLCVEQIGDYTVSGRIISESRPIFSSTGVNYHQPQNLPISDFDFEPPVIRAVPQGWVLGSGVYVSKGTCLDTLFWLQVEPPISDRFKRYELQQFESGSWTTIEQRNAGGLLAFNATVGSLYRVATVYDRGISEQFQYTKHFIFKTGEGDTGSGLSVHKPTYGSSFSSVSNFEVRIPTRITKQVESESHRLDSTYSKISNFLETQSLSKLSNDTESKSTYNTAGSLLITVIRNNGTNIGT